VAWGIGSLWSVLVSALAVITGVLVPPAPPSPAPAPAPVVVESRTPEESAAPSAPEEDKVDEISLVVVGDSISHADSEAFPGRVGSRSWVQYATGDGVRLAGGWAENGATTTDMLAGVLPVDADVLVLLAGTNDVGTGLAFETTAANLRQIVATVGAPRVIISAVPPRDDAPDATMAFNGTLQGLALAEGWEFTDPMGALREGGSYLPGMTDDGVHPTLPAAELIGAALRQQITAPGP